MAAGLMGQERRQAPRVDEGVSLAIRDATAELRTETKNISTVGVYCTLDRFIAPMTKLQLQFEIPNGARRVRVQGEGVVVRAEPVVTNAEQGHYNIAIFFTEITDHNRSVIARFVRERLTK